MIEKLGSINPGAADTGLWLRPAQYERKTGLPIAKKNELSFSN
ncbi:MAG TPA: hypothetical protein VEV16_13145 [Daejeonella sp.]|nr:hypothetical protein [Daejeonella sp.]